jgi:hypothetical protein
MPDDQTLEVHNELPNFGQGERVSRVFELMRRNQASSSQDAVSDTLAEIVRLFPGIRLGQSPIWVERAVRTEAPPTVLTEIFPLGHTDYFIHWDKRTYSWHFCTEVGFGNIVPLGSAQRRLYRKHEAIEAFFYIWWRKFRIESVQDGFCECPFQPRVHVSGVDVDAVLEEVWPGSKERDGYALRAVRKATASGLKLPRVFKAGTRFAEVNGVPVTYLDAEGFPLRWDTPEPTPFSVALLVSDGVPLTEEDFRSLVGDLKPSE